MLALYGFLLFIPFALNFLASRDDYRRYVDALFAAGMLAVIWAFTNAIASIFPFPENKQFHPLIDLIGLSVVVAAYMTQRQKWKLALAFLFLCQLCTHAAFWWGQNTAPIMSGRDYVGLLNVLWFAQLISVASPGAGHVAIRIVRRVRSHGGFPYMARH